MPAVFFYISGHGFGHASRQIEVVNALGARCPDLAIVVRTSAPRWLFDRTARVPITLVPGECDTGVIQIDSLRLDEQLTIERADAFYRTLGERARQEAALLAYARGPLRRLGRAAARLRGGRRRRHPVGRRHQLHLGLDLRRIRGAARRPRRTCCRRFAPPTGRPKRRGGCRCTAASPRSTPSSTCPFIARHARHGRDEVRRTLGLPLDRPLVLSSFGGYGVSGFDVAALDCLDVVRRRDHAPR